MTEQLGIDVSDESQWADDYAHDGPNEREAHDAFVERAMHAAAMLDRWAEALRGDWTQDGRQSRYQLNMLTDYLRGNRPTLTDEDTGLCPDGGSHWPEHCWQYGCKSAVAEGRETS